MWVVLKIVDGRTCAIIGPFEQLNAAQGYADAATGPLGYENWEVRTMDAGD